MLARWEAFDDRIAAFDTEFVAEVKQNVAARRLTSIPGIAALPLSTQLLSSLRSAKMARIVWALRRSCGTVQRSSSEQSLSDTGLAAFL